MSNDYYRNPTTPFLFTTSSDSDGTNGVNIVNDGDVEGENQLGDEPAGPVGMDCLPRCASSGPGPFHYLINEQAKSLVVLQELQQEVGALLEFRDLVIETFPNLRNKMVAAVSTSSSTSSTSSTIPLMTTGNGSSTNIPLIVRRDWEPGVRVRRRILHHKDGECSPSRSRSNSQSGLTGKGLNHQPKSTEATSVIQDSGFSTETSSSKETHSAASSTSAPTKDPPEEIEDELWNLLDVIHRKGTKLRDEVEALQGALCRKTDPEVAPLPVRITGNEDSDTSFQRQMFLFGNTMEDVVNLRRERDILLEKLTEMESENLAGRVQASRLQADLESLLSTKLELEEQLRIALSQKSELNSRIHDMHLQFVKTSPVRTNSNSNSPRLSSSPSDSGKIWMERPARRRRSSSKTTTIINPLVVSNEDGEIMTPSTTVNSADHLRRLNDLLGYDKNVPIKTRVVDSKKISAILQERDPLVLQQSLITVTVHNQVLKERLEENDKMKKGVLEELSKVRDEFDDLRFQLEEKSIELEGTRARVRVLEKGQMDKKSNSEIESPNGNESQVTPMLLRSRERQLTSCTTPSMKAMVPLALSDEGNSPSLSSSQQSQPGGGVADGGNYPTVEKDGGSVTSHRRKPSRIPLLGMPVNMSATATIRSLSRNTSASTSTSSTSLPRPTSAQSQTSFIPTPPRSASRTPKNSLTNGRSSRNNSDSFSRNFTNGSITSANSSIYLPGRSSTVCNKRDGLTTRMRRHNNASVSSRTNSNFGNGNNGLGLHGDGGDGGNNEVVAAEFNNTKLNSNEEMSSSPLISQEMIFTYPDSLDSVESPVKSFNYFADATNQLSYSWNFPRGGHCRFYSDEMNTASEYFDSINSDDSRRMEEMKFDISEQNEVLAECCDSLEKNLEVSLPNCDVITGKLP